MHFMIERAALKTAVDKVRNIIPRTGTIPILHYILIEVADNNLNMTATDLDVKIRFSGGDVQELKPGAICAPGHILSTAVNKLPSGSQIEVEIVDSELHFRAGRINFQLPTLPADDFPRLAMDGSGFKFTSQAKDLRKALTQAATSQSNEETRYYLNGVCIHPRDDTFEFVATNGHRLSKYILKEPGAIDGTPEAIIVPSRTVTEFMRLLDATGDIETVEIEATEAKIELRYAEIVITSKLIDGTFPDYKRVIPPRVDNTVTVDREILNAAIDRVSVFTKDKERGVVLFFAPDSIEIKSRAAEVGAGHEVVMVDYSGEEFYYGVNAGYLMDHLNAFEGQDLILWISPTSPERSPILITGEDERHEGVVMGMGVSGTDKR